MNNEKIKILIQGLKLAEVSEGGDCPQCNQPAFFSHNLSQSLPDTLPFISLEVSQMFCPHCGERVMIIENRILEGFGVQVIEREAPETSGSNGKQVLH